MLQLYETIISDGHGPLDASYLCVHETANPGATAYNHINYWSRDDKYAVHYVCDWTGRVYHCVPDDRKCNQVGYGNPYVIGIEICHAENQEDFDTCWDAAVEWAAYMLDKHCWGIDRLLCHDDCRRIWGGTDHTDPLEYFAEYGRSWDGFKDAVAAKMNGDEEMTDDDVTRIAEACANYTWGFERDGRPMVSWVTNAPTDTAGAVLGYTNEAMNGSDDVYQLITDTRRLGGWDYQNARLESVDAYQILRDVRDAVEELREILQELNDKVL